MAKGNGITVIMSLHEIDLAQKISDKIICVKGSKIANYGTPEEIFDMNAIKDLYNIDNGYFDPTFGSIELPKPVGEPKVFVISSGGTGVKVYRRLQKRNKPFIAGILYENDIDYQLADLLAANVISEKPFNYISDETFHKAVKAITDCEQVIDAGVLIGETNQRIVELLEIAKSQGKLKM